VFVVQGFSVGRLIHAYSAPMILDSPKLAAACAHWNVIASENHEV
jgi:hypothetical protein